MNTSTWENIVDKIDQQFGISSQTTVPLDDESGGSKEVVEFSGPQGEMKLEFVTKPRFLGEKTQYSNRIGGHVKVEKQYDEHETVNYFTAYSKSVNGEWEEINANMFAE